jgi:transcriptional regulator NrdR family protein
VSVPDEHPKAGRPKGFRCPSCLGHRLCVYKTRHVCPGKTVRYYKCSACGGTVTTEEIVAKGRNSRQKKRTANGTGPH